MNLYFFVRDLLSRPVMSVPSRLLLAPLTLVAWLYGRLLGARRWAYRSGALKGYRAGVPVISVGNITVGGTGKTPCVETVCRILLAEGVRPAILSRGYGGDLRDGWGVVSDGKEVSLDFRVAGDEPVLLAKKLPGVPVLVGADRRVTARAAVERYGAQALVLDDGFQHLKLARDLDIVNVDVRNPLGNGRCLPRGLLRERPQALRAAQLILLTRVNPGELGRAESLKAKIRPYNGRAPVLAARHAPVSLLDLNRGERHPLGELKGMKILAFAGIGNPGAFFQELGILGARVLEAIPFPDHRTYARGDMSKLQEWGRLMRAEALVTTEKDAVRLAPLLPLETPLFALTIELDFLEGGETFREAVLGGVGLREPPPAMAPPAKAPL